MNSRYTTTFETWNKVAALYQEKFMHLDLYNDTYDIFCSLFKNNNAAVLEIGCGPGNITKYVLEQQPHFKITATDVAPNMIALAQINNPTADFKILDCRTLDTITGKFNGIICGFCIPYLSKKDTEKLLKDCYGLLTNEGILYFSTIKGDHAQSGYEAASTGDRSYVYYYEEDFFKEELSKNGFKLLHLIEKEFLKSDGTKMINQIFIAQKNLPGMVQAI